MMHSMVKITNKAGEVFYATVPEKNAQAFIEIVAEYDAKSEIFTAGKMPLGALPEETQAKVKSVLKAFDEVSVVYERGQFNVSASVGIYAQYAYDHCTCGRYKQEEVYTKEERAKNFKEEFGYVPFYLN